MEDRLVPVGKPPVEKAGPSGCIFRPLRVQQGVAHIQAESMQKNCRQVETGVVTSGKATRVVEIYNQDSDGLCFAFGQLESCGRQG